ncbi:hypothetical protein BCEP4_1120025 [Burkholderia cepacia]|nr:hypothetical protein BCEP4_1120025 [Burkholderia cepacia]
MALFEVLHCDTCSTWDWMGQKKGPHIAGRMTSDRADRVGDSIRLEDYNKSSSRMRTNDNNSIPYERDGLDFRVHFYTSLFSHEKLALVMGRL